MDFFKVINKRRSVRQYTNKPVPREVLEKVVQAGIEAPTGCNAQLKQYVVVDDPAVMAKLHPVSKALRGAPAAIVLVVDPKPTEYGEYWPQDAAAAMENMLLAIVASGYGGCWIEGALRRQEAYVKQLLGVPESLRVIALTPVGKPAAPVARPAKPTMTDVLHYNRF
jgi:nitroreductase